MNRLSRWLALACLLGVSLAGSLWAQPFPTTGRFGAEGKFRNLLGFTKKVTFTMDLLIQPQQGYHTAEFRLVRNDNRQLFFGTSLHNFGLVYEDVDGHHEYVCSAEFYEPRSGRVDVSREKIIGKMSDMCLLVMVDNHPFDAETCRIEIVLKNNRPVSFRGSVKHWHLFPETFEGTFTSYDPNPPDTRLSFSRKPADWDAAWKKKQESWARIREKRAAEHAARGRRAQLRRPARRGR